MSETTAFPIRIWSEDDRPREKLIQKGAATLTDAELVAILLGSGSSRESALALAQRLLSAAENNLGNLSKLTLAQLRAFKGIGPAKAVSIAAAMELARRRSTAPDIVSDKIASSQDVYRLMRPLIADLAHEEFWVIYLNNANRVLKKLQLSKGGLTGTLVDIRLTYKSAIELSATGIILCHNHPSGTLYPSEADKQLTQKMRTAGDQLDIKVLDHLIVTAAHYYSFADEGTF